MELKTILIVILLFGYFINSILVLYISYLIEIKNEEIRDIIDKIEHKLKLLELKKLDKNYRGE